MNTPRNQIVKPDIFVTGVMKGGTTILHDYICTHPSIDAGRQKEIHYFSLHYHKGPEWYASHFVNVSENNRTIDASPTYFDAANTSQIPRLINAYTEEPRVIVITRDPIARAISQFIHLKVTTKTKALQDVDIEEFFSMSLAEAYRQSNDIAFNLNLVLSFSMYERKLITYMQEFNDNQFLALDNEILRQKPEDTMAEVFEFLNLPFVANDLFGVVKHSNGSSIGNVSQETYNKLADLFYPDYMRYCKRTGIKFVETPYSVN
ncbi:MAG: sulfotransferase domain-containing protein [Granulosicoccus sp.]